MLLSYEMQDKCEDIRKFDGIECFGRDRM